MTEEIITIIKKGDQVTIRKKEIFYPNITLSSNNIDSIKIIADTTKPEKQLTIKDWVNLEKKVNRAYFWDLAQRESFIELEGKSWTFEGKNWRPFTGGHAPLSYYHNVIRFSPPDNDYKEMCIFLLNLEKNAK